MNILTTINHWQKEKKILSMKSIGFVPTMGNLHDGHISLIKRSKSENDITIVSIFINPTQFNQQSDYDLYPRTIREDQALLQKNGVDYLFFPSREEIYHDQFQVRVDETSLSLELEGKYRPGHFTGMLTIVLKLLNIVNPTNAYFGEKDYQQLLLVKKMVDALFLPINIIACPTVRASDGLALSSRNTRLTSEQRELAAHFPRLLACHLPVEKIKEELQNLGFQVDYIFDQWQRRLGAVWLSDVRLIDNFKIGD